jgi:pimeloyl-ACP methyl ester carboxylesterase
MRKVAPVPAQKPAACVDATPHTIRFVTVAPGVELEVIDWGGAGATMVLLTGSGDNAHVYDQFAFQFTDYFHVIGITRRGWLPSSQPTDGHDVPTRAADDVAVLDALGIEKAVFVGHSAAGMELTELGRAHGARVDKLVYLDAADLAERFLPTRREPPLPEYTDADTKSLWAFQAATARYQAIREPNPSLCLRVQFGLEAARPGLRLSDRRRRAFGQERMRRRAVVRVHDARRHDGSGAGTRGRRPSNVRRRSRTSGTGIRRCTSTSRSR